MNIKHFVPYWRGVSSANLFCSELYDHDKQFNVRYTLILFQWS